MRLKGELDALRPISPEQEARILQKFRLDWNYHSNHIEGNSLTYGETKSLLLHGITAQGKPLKDHLEITGHNEAIDWVMDVVKGSRPLTETFVRELHKLLLREPYEVDAITPDGKPTKRLIQVGQYKAVPNHVRTVTGAIHYFASPEETPAEMHKLMDWYREQHEDVDTNPIFLAALFHHRFISIHPFDDGNGRTGRLLMNFILMQHGYPPVVIKTEDKINYYRALQQADGGNHDAFVEYMAVNLVRSLEIMLAGARGESIEEPDDLDKELALLKLKLAGLGKKVEVVKSEEAIRKVLLESIWPLGKEIVAEQERFRDFYTQFRGRVHVYTVGDIDLLSRETPNLLDFKSPPHGGSIDIDFRGFIQLDLRDIYFHIGFQLEFQDTYWVLKRTDDTRSESHILYSEALTLDKMKELAKAEAIRHKEIIERAIEGNKS